MMKLKGININKKNVNSGSKKFLILQLLYSLIFVFFCGTFALWIWESASEQNTNVSFIVEMDEFTCFADGGEPLTPPETVLQPSTCTGNSAIVRDVTTDVKINYNEFYVYMDLWLEINDIGIPLTQTDNFKYALTTSSNSCTDGVISYGNFNGVKVGDKINILNKYYGQTLNEKYYLYIWLDEAETNTQTSSQSFNISLGGNCSGEPTEVSEPILDEGMVPVIISDTGVVTTVSTDSDDWYNYANAEWANIVLVNKDATEGVENSKSREYYLSNPGTEVIESDILAYYVWVPRYKYKIWTTGLSSTGQEQTIDIVFESKSEPMSLGTQVGEYRTHPSFWWDYDSDGVFDTGETIGGMWVGKFETTGDETTPTVKPNLTSLTNQTVSSQFNTALKFAGGIMNTETGEVFFEGNSTYGLSSETDSHMMKNSEWGAVAYLSHSNFGINDEIRINNYNNAEDGPYKTGCGALTSDAAESTECGIFYKKPSAEKNTYPQSTTGNITGVFDMSGGTNEYMMANYSNITSSSGFSVYPFKKYYDGYSSLDSGLACDEGLCYGHALSETSGWHSDGSNFVNDTESWLLRGGSYENTTGAGAFYSYTGTGVASETNGFRSVLIPLVEYVVMFDGNGGNVIQPTEISQSYTLSGEYAYSVPITGKYKLEVWGAQGGTAMRDGSAYAYNNGYGGYSVGTVFLDKFQFLFVNVGGRGSNGGYGTVAGGYNGGGKGTYDGSDDEGAGGGGGATHIAMVSGVLSSLSGYEDDCKNLSSNCPILIVAGGGGGSAWTYSAGAGGGFNGGYTGNTSSSYPTQTSGYAFGQGQNGSGVADSDGVAGGGGGFYGGYGENINKRSAGTGGSGYIGNPLLSDKAMYCYNCNTSTDVNTLTYSTTNNSSTPTANYAKSGAGAAKITLIDGIFDISNKRVMYNSTYGDMPVPTKDGYTFLGWYTEPDGGEKVTSDTLVELDENHTLYAHWAITSANISLMANDGEITSSTTDGTNTYNWSLTDDFIYLDGEPIFYNIRNVETVDLPNYNDETYLNLSKNDTVVYDGEEWVCLVGCDRIGKTFDQDVEYTALDFCGDKNSECSVILGVNWLNVYMITYDANGGTGAPAAHEKHFGVPTNLSDVKPTNGGYEFLGWSTDPNATSATYVPGEEFLINESINLYAIWAPDTILPTCSLSANSSTITATYSDTGGSSVSYYGWDSSLSGSLTKTKSVSNGTHTYYVSDNAGNIGACQAVVTGTSQVCNAIYSAGKCWWYNNGVQQEYGFDYECGSGYTKLSNSYCFKKLNTYVVRFNANGGEGAPAIQVKTSGSALTLSTVVPVKEGYVFLGWSADQNATVQTYVPGDSYTTDANVILYAVWSATNDTTSPSCTLSINSNLVISAKYFDAAPSAGIGYYGWDSLFSGEKSTSKTINSTGNYVYYVKDNFGNTGTCNMNVISTSVTQVCPSGTSPTNGGGGNLACYYYCAGNGDGNGHCYTSKVDSYYCSGGYTKLSDKYCYLAS